MDLLDVFMYVETDLLFTDSREFITETIGISAFNTSLKCVGVGRSSCSRNNDSVCWILKLHDIRKSEKGVQFRFAMIYPKINIEISTIANLIIVATEKV